MTIAAAAMATVGANPPTTPAGGYQQASPGGTSFTGTSLPPPGTVFAATQTALMGSATQLGPDTATNAQGATMTVIDASKGQYELKIPGVGLDENVRPFGSPGGQSSGPDTHLANGTYLNVTLLRPNPGTDLNYVMFDQWTLKDTADQQATNTGWLMTGFQTPPASMPTTGSANYMGYVKGQAFVAGNAPFTNNGQPVPAIVTEDLFGTGSLSANFSTGALTGVFGLNYSSASQSIVSRPWNTVSITGTVSGAGLTGSTSSSSPLVGGTGHTAGAGTIAGGFYGPTQNELGAIWTLSDDASTAVGVFGAPEMGPATVGAFALATFATTTYATGRPPDRTDANGFHEATPGGPTMASVPDPTVFALLQSTVAISASPGATSITADTTTNSYGGTLTMTGGKPVNLIIPDLGPKIDGYPTSVGSVTDFEALKYTALGSWAVPGAIVGAPSNVGWFIIGYQTPVASMPTTGTANYSNGVVRGQVFTPAVSATLPYTSAPLSGTASLTADFASGAVTGSLTGMQVDDAGGAHIAAWNGVSLSATISGNSFAGSTAATSSPTGAAAAPYVLAGSATGTVAGGFYGPAADEAGAVWTLSDGQRSAIGSLGAAKAPSDRRLKRDIVPLRRLANGVELYSYRYLGDARTFVGVMAQDLLNDARWRDAVAPGPEGFYWVDYGRLGLAPSDLGAMREAGLKATAICRRRVEPCVH